MDIAQAGIAVFGPVAIFLANSKTSRWRFWGGICGLCSQPFWFLTTWQNQQWAIFVLSVFYTISWGRGVWNNRKGGR